MVAEKRLNVLQICHDYEGPFRSVCAQYARGFAGHRVTTVYLRGEEDDSVRSETGGERVVFLEQGPLRGVKLATILRVASLFRRETFDVVIAHRYKPIYIAGVMSYFFPIRVLLGIVHEHGVFKRITRSLLLTLWCRNINVVAVSETVRRDVLKDVPALARRQRLFTLNHAIDVSRSLQLMTREDARRALDIPADLFCFGTVGRLVAKKDHDVLIEAYKRAALADTRLVIAGSGGRQNELMALSQASGLAGKVVFTGHLDDAWRYLRAFDVFVLPSGAREAFGIVLLEAMLAGLPIICSDAPGPLEVIGGAGVTFRVGDADELATRMRVLVATDPASRNAMGEGAFARLEDRFSMDVFTTNLLAIAPVRELLRSVG